MDSGKKKVILLEHSKSHQDILYAQILFLSNSGYKPVLWINEELAIDNEIAESNADINRYKFDNSKHRKNFVQRLKLFADQCSVNNIILNTAQGIQARNIVFSFLRKKINFIGILHEAERLSKSFTQKTISYKIKNILY